MQSKSSALTGAFSTDDRPHSLTIKTLSLCLGVQIQAKSVYG